VVESGGERAGNWIICILQQKRKNMISRGDENDGGGRGTSKHAPIGSVSCCRLLCMLTCALYLHDMPITYYLFMANLYRIHPFLQVWMLLASGHASLVLSPLSTTVAAPSAMCARRRDHHLSLSSSSNNCGRREPQNHSHGKDPSTNPRHFQRAQPDPTTTLY